MRDDQVTYTANRIGDDQPVQMVYTEVIAAAINYDTSGEQRQTERGPQAVKLADLAASLERSKVALANRKARSAAFKTVADAVHQADPDPKVTAAAATATARQAEKRRRDEQRRRHHDTRPDGPARGPSIH